MPDLPPAWPRALRIELAAAYLGMSEASFARHCDVAPVYYTPHIKVWLIEDLDRWLDARAGRVAGSAKSSSWKI